MVGMVSDQATLQVHLLFVHHHHPTPPPPPLDDSLLHLPPTHRNTFALGPPGLGIDCSNPEVRMAPPASLLKGNTCPRSGSDSRGP